MGAPTSPFYLILISAGKLALNELPVIESLRLRKEMWDRHGENLATQ